MKSYTPGPWIIWDEGREMNPDFATGPPIICAPPASTGYEETEDIAYINVDSDEYGPNAYLIAAAPDLFETLIVCRNKLKNLLSIMYPYPENLILMYGLDISQLLDEIERIINKVEGGGI